MPLITGNTGLLTSIYKEYRLLQKIYGCKNELAIYR